MYLFEKGNLKPITTVCMRESLGVMECSVLLIKTSNEYCINTERRT